MDAIGVALVAVGGFLLYASVRGQHPFTLFQKTVGTYKPEPAMVGALAPAAIPGGNATSGPSVASAASGTVHP